MAKQLKTAMASPRPKTGSRAAAKQAYARAEAWARSEAGARYGEARVPEVLKTLAAAANGKETDA